MYLVMENSSVLLIAISCMEMVPKEFQTIVLSISSGSSMTVSSHVVLDVMVQFALLVLMRQKVIMINLQFVFFVIIFNFLRRNDEEEETEEEVKEIKKLHTTPNFT